MRKSIIFPLCLILLASCAHASEPAPEFKIAATFYPVWLAAANITRGVEGVSLTLLTPHDAGCLHDHQLTPGELESVRGAELVLALGGAEGFLGRIKQAYPDIPLAECGDGDEHSWVFVNDYIKMVNRAGSAIINADPGRADDYESNLRLYLEDLSLLAQELNVGLVNLSASPVIMFHEGFESWSLAYGLNIAATVESEPGAEPPPRDLADIIDMANETGVKALFVGPQYAGAAAHTVARETGVKIYELDPVAGGSESLDFYQKAMRQNVETVLAALGHE
ncbi:MAG: metal ABC transporter substrate-binding protein [Oscillospiraceae bacterium]|nr:metal ABC transporter substrate-binding protein [Oscillospiraceae bacterium]